MSKELKILQSEEYQGEDWWKWAVWLEGNAEALDHVEFVEWTLHPSFRDPIRTTRNRSDKFRLETGGWGVFIIHARVGIKDGSSLRLHHSLRLHYPSGEENTA